MWKRLTTTLLLTFSLAGCAGTISPAGAFVAGVGVGYLAGSQTGGETVPTICDYETIGDITDAQARRMIADLGRDGFINDVAAIKRGQIRECR